MLSYPAVRYVGLRAALGAAIASATAFFWAPAADVLPLTAFCTGGLIGGYLGWRRQKRTTLPRRWGAISLRATLVIAAVVAAVVGMLSREAHEVRIRHELLNVAVFAGEDSGWIGDYARKLTFYSPSLHRLSRRCLNRGYYTRLTVIWLGPMDAAAETRVRKLASQLRDPPKVYTHEQFKAERARRQEEWARLAAEEEAAEAATH